MNPLEQRTSAGSQSVMLEALTAVELAMEGISKLDDTGHYVFLNRQYATLLGYRPDELVGQSWELTVHPDDHSAVMAAFTRMLAAGKAEGEFRGIRKDGTVFDKHVVIVKPQDPAAGQSGHYCFVKDITERKLKERQEQATQQLLASITRVQSLYIDDERPAAVFDIILEELLRLTNSEYGLIEEVRSGKDQLELRTDAITSIVWNRATPTETSRQTTTLESRDLRTWFGQIIASGQPVIANDRVNDPGAGGLSPGYPPMHAFLGLPLFHRGVLTGMVGIANRPGGYDESMVAFLQPFLGTCAQLVDGYRSKCLQSEAEEALRTSEERFRVAMEGANGGYWDWDLCTNEVYFSERWKNMIGYDDHELANVYSEWESRLHSDDHARVISGLTDYLQSRQGVYDVEFRLRKKDGTYCWIHARGKAVWDAEGRPIRMAGFHEDISGQKWEEVFLVADKQAQELVAQGCPLKEVLTALCRSIENYTAPMLSSIMLVTEDGSHLSAAAGPSLSEEYSRRINRIPIGPTIGSCGSAAYYRQPAIVCEIATDPLWKGFAHVALAHGLQACWSQPILSSAGTLLGTFAAYFREPRQPLERDFRLIEQASHIAARAIEHVRSLDAVRESEERFRVVFLHEPECVKTVAPDGTLLAMNPTGLRMIEADSLDEVIGRSVLPLIHPDDRSVFWEVHCAAIKGSPGTLEFRVIGLKGTLRWMETHCAPLQETGSTSTAVLSVTRDVTERKRLEQVTQDQTDRLRLAMDIAGLAIWDWNILTNEVIWSENCEQVKRLPVGSFERTFEAYQRLVHPEDLPGLQADIESALSGQKPYHTEHRIVPPAGEVQWIEGNGVVYRDELGRPIRMVGTARNITERKRMEQVLRLNEERYVRATAVGKVGVWELDVRAGTYYGDRNLKAMVGYQDDGLSADLDAWLSIVHPDDQSIVMAHWQRIVKGEADDYQYELRMVKKDSTVIWTHVRGRAARDTGGQVTHLIGAIVDITDRKRMENAVRDSEKRLRTLYDDNPSMYFTVAPDFSILSVNRFGARQLGYQPHELIGRSVCDVVYELDEAFVLQELDKAFSDRNDSVKSLEFRKRTKNGEIIWVRERVRILREGEGVALIVCEDVTARKQAEASERLFRALLDQVTDSIEVIDPSTGRFLDGNRQSYESIGYTREELLCLTVPDIDPQVTAPAFQTHMQHLGETDIPLRIESLHLRKDGTTFPVEVSAQLITHDQEYLVAIVRDITRRKQVEEHLRRVQFAMNQAVDAVYWVDPQARILYTNEAASAMLGYTADEFLRMTVHDLNPDFPAEVWPAFWSETREKKVVSLETNHRTKDGRLVPIDIRVSFLAYGGQEFHCAFVRDISVRKRVDQALRESQERFELAVGASYDGIWDWNILTGEQYWSDRHFELFGLTTGELTPSYDSWIALVHPADAELVHQVTRRHLETRALYDIEVRVRMKDGSYRWFRDRGQAVWDESGRPVRMVGSITDITARRQAEEAIWRANAELEQRVVERTKELAAANRSLEEEIVERKRIEAQLRDQERQLNDAQTIAHLGSWELDVTANRLKWSDETCRIFGLTPQEFSETYEEFLDRVHSDDRAMVAEAYSRSLRSESGAYEIEHRIVVQGTGEIRVVHEKCIHMRDESGKVMKSVGMVHDITARKRAEEAVRESELRYKLVTEATFDAIALHDNGVLLEVNAGLERMFGYESGELLGRSILDLVADESCDQIVLNMQNGVVGPYETVGRRKDGTTFPGELVVRPYHYCGKEVRLVAGRDITERKQLELQLARHTEELERQVAERTSEIAKLEAQRVQTEKLAAVGQMAAAVAHEINNPIAGIRNAFTLVKQAVDPAHPHYEFVGMIDREITRVASIVKNMYQLYRKEPSKVEPVNLSLLLRDLESLFAERLSQLGLTLVVTQVPLRSRLLVPQSDLLQVLMNLIQNGIDSSFEGGTITLSICQDEELVRIRVSDEGSGIPPDVLPHIFDPFFTTKTEKGQKGMGLGLSVSQSLVMAMGGRMEVQTEQGAGSTFSIILPEPAAGSQASGHRNIIQEVLTHET